MPNESDDFFEGKRPWSRIKDRILGSYMKPYVAKVMKNVGQPLLLIDAFAGPGKFGDGSPGSPLIICEAAATHAKGNYRAIFVNEKRKYHLQLDAILRAGGWHPAATAILGDGQDLLRAVVPLLKTQSVFLYIDPFGLDCEFDTLEPFLARNRDYSTEILINLSAGFHRLAAREALISGTGDPDQIAGWHAKLTRTLGGDYWKEALLADNGMEAKAREQLVIDGYRQRLSSTGYLTYTGACPILERRDSATKYYMVFASRHPAAMVLFNDAMCKAFNEYLHEQETQDTLFAGQHWTAWHDTRELMDIVVSYTHKFPGRSRARLWQLIVLDHFMRFTHSEYIKAVASSVKAGRISYSSSTGKLNNDCILNPV